MKSITVGARKFQVEFRVSDYILDSDKNVQSYTDHLASLIVIRDDPSFSVDAKQELIVHEILHAIIKNAGLHECLKDGFTEEFIVSALAPRIHSLLCQLDVEL